MPSPRTPWGPSPDDPVLDPGGVHLWRAPLLPDCAPVAGGEVARLANLLSPDERARAARLRAPAKAHAFVVGRARLRQILARYLDLPPADLAFAYGPHGKPALAAGAGPLHFNLAHSGTWLLVAIADRPLGIDLEQIDPALDFAPLAARFFTPAEQRRLTQAPPHRRRPTFYRLWTCKEAYLKGRGGGFSEGAGGEIADDWRVENLFFRHDYAAALALPRGAIEILRRWTWRVG